MHMPVWLHIRFLLGLAHRYRGQHNEHRQVMRHAQVMAHHGKFKMGMASRHSTSTHCKFNPCRRRPQNFPATTGQFSGNPALVIEQSQRAVVRRETAFQPLRGGPCPNQIETVSASWWDPVIWWVGFRSCEYP